MSDETVSLSATWLLTRLDEAHAMIGDGGVEEAQARLVEVGDRIRSLVAAQRIERAKTRSSREANKKRKVKNPTPEREMPTLDLKAQAAGYATYDAYLASSHWREVKARYGRSWPHCACVMCGHRDYHLHHLTYVRLGRELLADLVPFCKPCHDAIHRTHREVGIPLENFARAMQVAFGLPDREIEKRLRPYYELPSA